MTEPEVQSIEIPIITLVWSDWHTWDSLKLDIKADPKGVVIPKAKGVYEVKYRDTEERLTIGKASDLRRRIKRGLIAGVLPHSSGERIRAEEDTSQIVVRWAETSSPAAVEEELHRRHKARFNRLPKHTKVT